MTPKKSTLKIVTVRRLARAAVLALALGLVGCGDGDANDQAIVKARIDLETLGALHQEGVTGEKVSYEKVVTDLAKAADSSAPGQAAAARILRSRAFLRQGDEQAAGVGLQEREAQAAAIRSHHNQWLDLNAQAQALQKFDATKGLAQIDADVKAKQGEIDHTKGELAKAEQELKSLTDRAAASQEKSHAQRDRELDFRNQMIDKTQTQRADLVRQANEAKRAGDASDLEAADLLAQAARQRPVIAELQTRVQRLEAQKLMQDASKTQLIASAENARQQAARALNGGKDDRGAKQVGEALAGAVKELGELRAGIQEPSEKASHLYEQALGEVKKTQGGGGGGGGPRGGGGADAKLAEAAVHHAAADLLLARARGFEAYASLLTLLAETKPALAGSAEYAKSANEAAESAKTTLTQAQEAFGLARGLYEGAGATEKAQDVKDRLEQIAKSLAVYDSSKPVEAAEGDKPGDEVATVPATKPAETPTDEAKPTAATFEGEKAEVFALLQKLSEVQKTNDADGLLPLLVFRNTEQEESFKKLMPMMAKIGALSDACKEQFGMGYKQLEDEQAASVGARGGMAKMENPGQRALQKLNDEELKADDVQIKILPGGDDAEVTFKSATDDTLLECTKIEGAWRVKLDFSQGGMLAGALNESMMQNLTQLYETMTANVKSGKYGKDPKKMFDDFMKEAMKLAPKGEEGDK